MGLVVIAIIETAERVKSCLLYLAFLYLNTDTKTRLNAKYNARQTLLKVYITI